MEIIDEKKDAVMNAAAGLVKACEQYFFTNRTCDGCPLQLDNSIKREWYCRAHIPMGYDVRLTRNWPG